MMFWIYATIYELVMGVVSPPKVRTSKMVGSADGGVNGVNGIHKD